MRLRASEYNEENYIHCEIYTHTYARVHTSGKFNVALSRDPYKKVCSLRYNRPVPDSNNDRPARNLS